MSYLHEDFRLPSKRSLQKLVWGSVHSNFNFKYKIPNFIHIVFHNISGYDVHVTIRELDIKELDTKFKTKYIGFISENKEKYISFDVKINSKIAGVRKKRVKKYIRIFS